MVHSDRGGKDSTYDAVEPVMSLPICLVARVVHRTIAEVLSSLPMMRWCSSSQVLSSLPIGLLHREVEYRTSLTYIRRIEIANRSIGLYREQCEQKTTHACTCLHMLLHCVVLYIFSMVS